LSEGKKVAVVAHCILNQLTVAHGLASYPGAVKELVEHLVARSYGILQLPCPEATYLGLRRWWMSREQYDTASYREHCRRILQPVVFLIKELTREGVSYIVIGVKGSPSCGVLTSTSNKSWRGDPSKARERESEKVNSPGVFMEEFLEMLGEAGVPPPSKIIEVDHEEISKSGLPEELAREL